MRVGLLLERRRVPLAQQSVGQRDGRQFVAIAGRTRAGRTAGAVQTRVIDLHGQQRGHLESRGLRLGAGHAAEHQQYRGVFRAQGRRFEALGSRQGRAAEELADRGA